MDVKAEVIEIIDELFMEDVSDMMDEDLFDARNLSQLPQQRHIIGLIRIQVGTGLGRQTHPLKV